MDNLPAPMMPEYGMPPELLAMLEGDPSKIPDEIMEQLPHEMRQMLIDRWDARQQQLAALANTLSRKRHEAVAGRKNSGIEDEWTDVQDAYEGVDDANRHERAASKPDRTGSYQPAKRNTNRSTVFLNITGPYVDGAAARMADMLLPTDDQPWSIAPTPFPDMPGVPAESFEQLEAMAREKAEAAQRRINDWLVECQWHGEVRKVIEDAARLGTGVLKGPTPRRKKYQSIERVEDGSTVLKIEHEIAPQSRRVNPWNLYPDPACGTNIHNGNYLLERDYITARQLRDLMGVNGYLDDQIREALNEGPSRREVEIGADGPAIAEGDKFEIWYYHGHLTPDDLEVAGCSLDDDLKEDDKVIPATVTMVNDRIIKAAVSHLESGDFPYDVLPWRQRDGMPWGIGVGKQINVPQRMLNAATRNLMDNSGLSSGPQTVMRRGAIVPADSRWELTPRKLWFLNEGADVDDVRKALFSFDIPSMQNELMGIIQFALRMAEEVTGLPQIMQGQQGGAPDTATGMQIVNNNANTVLRRLAKNFDDYITEPHIRRYYEWLMLYGDEGEKGDYTVDARGSSALVERDIQHQAILQMGEMTLNPAFGIDPRKWFAEMCKAQRLDPAKFQMDEGEQQIPPEVQEHIAMLEQQLEQLQQQQAHVEAARIRAEAMVQGKQIEAEARLQAKQIDAQAKAQGDQLRAMAAEQVAHVRGQYAKEIEYMRQELQAIDKEIKIADSETRRGQLQLQRQALEAQLQAHHEDMEVALAKINRDNPEQVMLNNQYGKIPYAIG